jgi:hypothetical protein
MNAYLVVLRGGMDDLPLSLHGTKEEAIEAAYRVVGNPQAALDSTTLSSAWPRTTTADHVRIVHFRGGVPADEITVEVADAVAEYGEKEVK